MTPLATPVADSPHFRVIFDQLAATYFLFAFNEAVVLRLTADVRVWKALLFGIACCDAVHIWGTSQALGGLHVLISMRLAFCCGVGLGGLQGKGVKVA